MVQFCSNMSLEEVNRISVLGLAHIGDGVYELLVRTMLCRQGYSAVTTLHKHTVSFVNAAAQAEAVRIIHDMLTPEELSLFKRGRNTKVNTVPHNANISDYHSATGLEALFGWLYLQGKLERIDELFAAIIEKQNDRG